MATDTLYDLNYETKYSQGIDVASMEKELIRKIKGEVRFDYGTKALYATDASNYRQVPIGVVLPKTEEDIINTVAICRKYHAPVLCRGGGTSLTGSGCNVAVMMDMTKYYNKVLKIDKEKKTVTVQPGIVLDEMRNATKKEANLTFGPDPATHSHCAIGGMLGNDSCGIHSVMSAFYGYGARTADNTESLTILTYDGLKMKIGPTSDDELEKIIKEGGRKGEVYQQLKDLRDKYADKIREKFPSIPRRVSGYNLPSLLPEQGFNLAAAIVGSEGTCVTILEAEMKLMPEPAARSLLVLGYTDIVAAGHACPGIMKHHPIGLEGFDELLIEYMENKGLNVDDIPLLPKGQGWLLVEFDGKDKTESDNKCRELMEELKKGDNPPNMNLFDDPDQEQKLWEVRESGLGATAFVPAQPDRWTGWEDSAVPPDKVGDYLKDLRELFSKYGYKPAIYGHLGQGCIHCRVAFDFVTEPGIEKYKKFTIEASHLVVSFGGSLSGEHGDGQSRGSLLHIMYGEEIMKAFHEFKAIWDSQWMMNPGKVIDSYGQLADLRMGPNYNPPAPKTHFHFMDDDDKESFARATLRCVGVGNCRQHEGGTMCPSYMVTREEKDSTRGRAHLLFEMLNGNVIKDGWNDEYVKESLDLCLACKGCKGDCPVNVDIATLKSEFLSHYYEKNQRPASAFAFGWIYWWSRIASVIPGVVNFVTHAPVLRNILKSSVGVTQKRTIPSFAQQTFRNWFDKQPKRNTNKPKVILWVDTWNNFFKPETLVAAMEVLEVAGFQVIIANRVICCGRPLYDFGMLDTAKKMLFQILDTLRDEIRAGTSVVGLEPSCVSVFRDELCDLIRGNEDAKRLKKQTFTLAEFLEKKAPDFKIPQLKRNAIVQAHCHHRAIMKIDSEETLLKKIGLDYQVLDSGCCGMAGYFGYLKDDKYDVSVAAGERVMLPAVRGVDKKTLIIANGYSCREQIEQMTDREGMHIAQVLQMGLRENGRADSEATNYPEKKYVDNMKLHSTGLTVKRAVVALSVIGLVAFGCLLLSKKKKK